MADDRVKKILLLDRKESKTVSDISEFKDSLFSARHFSSFNLLWSHGLGRPAVSRGQGSGKTTERRRTYTSRSAEELQADVWTGNVLPLARAHGDITENNYYCHERA